MGIDWSQWTDWIEAPLRIVVIIGLGILLRYVIHRLIDRLVAKASGLEPPKRLFGSAKAASLVKNGSTLLNERRRQRSEALGSLFKSVTSLVLSVIIVFMCLSELGYDLAPLIASAGIVGVALGFGAQNLVKDFLSGVFMLLEDQYGVGDYIDLGEAVGTVESVGLRVSKLRDLNGITWYVRNGEVLRVGNHSQGWSALLLDVSVAPDADIDRVRALLNQTARELSEDPDWQSKIIATPEVIGVQDMSGLALTVRLWGKCATNEHWGVGRELRRRMKEVLDREGIDLPVPIMPWAATT